MDFVCDKLDGYGTPVDVYCVKPTQAEKNFESFYGNNTGLPGPISKMTRPATTVQPRTTFNSLRDEVRAGRTLSYASPSMVEMVGAPVLPGIQAFDAFNMPVDYFTRQVIQKERCGCGSKTTDKKFTPAP